MKRREFIVILVGVLIASPFRTSARQPERMRRIGMLMNLTAADPEAQTRITRVRSPVGTCGSTSVGVETPKVIAKVRRSLPRPHLTSSWRPPDPALAAAQQVTCTVPIVLVNMIDPVGYVKSLSRPGGNITGFTLYEYSTAGHKCIGQNTDDLRPYEM